MGYVKQHDERPDHPKLLLAGPLATHLDDVAIMWCNRNRTDGFVPRRQVRRLVDWEDVWMRGPSGGPEEVDSMFLAEILVSVGRWEKQDKGWQIHNYLKVQSSAEQIEAARLQRVGAGKKGGLARAARRTASDSPEGSLSDSPSEGASESLSETSSGSQAGAKRDSSKNEEGRSKESSYELSSSGKELCDLLAELVIANGRPKHLVDPKARGWQDAARLMLDRDKRDPDEAKRLIRWCQADEFWRSNILSMPKFREQYDRLRLRAAKDNGHVPSPSHHADEVEATRRRLEEAEA